MGGAELFYLSTMRVILSQDYIVATDDKTAVLVRRHEVAYYNVSILKSKIDVELIILIRRYRACSPFFTDISRAFPRSPWLSRQMN